MILEFPPIEMADPESGLLAIGGDLEIESLLLAYRNGIFPWPHNEKDLLWFAPPIRAILDFKNFHIPHRLQRHLKKANFTFRINYNFSAVIIACATRKYRDETWITPKLSSAYIDFHKAGFAHSFETYNEKDELVGGLYGIKIGRFFAGESMFYRAAHASKFALIQTIYHLQKNGLTWMDIQMLTPLLASFGGEEMPRSRFMERLKATLE